MKKATLLITLICIILGHASVRAENWPEIKRREMIEFDIKGRGISDERIINIMSKIPRERFVDPFLKKMAYDDRPLPIGHGQTISQPFVVAYMTEALKLKGDETVLEIGTGSGYQAAVLAEIVPNVYTIEIQKDLASSAAERLKDMAYTQIRVKHADGYDGWPEAGPFDAIMITCAANHIPPPLLAQLKMGGRLILPLGSTRYFQTLTLVTKTQKGLIARHLIDVSFVPMIGKIQKEIPKPEDKKLLR